MHVGKRETNAKEKALPEITHVECFEITQILPPCIFMEFLFLQSGGYGQKLKTGCDPVSFSLIKLPSSNNSGKYAYQNNI